MEKDSESREELVPILRSTDLVDWTDVGEAFERSPDWWDDDASLWAPDVNYYGGQYYLYYSYSVWGSNENPGIGLATADSPEGPFVDQGPVFRESDIGVTNAIDSEFRVVDERRGGRRPVDSRQVRRPTVDARGTLTGWIGPRSRVRGQYE